MVSDVCVFSNYLPGHVGSLSTCIMFVKDALRCKGAALFQESSSNPLRWCFKMAAFCALPTALGIIMGHLSRSIFLSFCFLLKRSKSWLINFNLKSPSGIFWLGWLFMNFLLMIGVLRRLGDYWSILLLRS